MKTSWIIDAITCTIASIFSVAIAGILTAILGPIAIPGMILGQLTGLLALLFIGRKCALKDHNP